MSDSMRLKTRLEGFVFLAAFALCIPLSNWMLGNVGAVCPANGPCLIPIGFGMMAPSGVLVVGLALMFRDMIQRRLGVKWALVAIAIGAFLSWWISAPSLVVASVVAFLFSELVDLAIFTPLQKRGLIKAVVLSSSVALVIDSLLFLSLAFGSLDFLPEQIVGKGWMVLATIPAIYLIRKRDERLGLMPA